MAVKHKSSVFNRNIVVKKRELTSPARELRTAAPVCEPLNATLRIAIEDLVTGLARATNYSRALPKDGVTIASKAAAESNPAKCGRLFTPGS
jgi:hypothetical protein